MKFSNT